METHDGRDLAMFERASLTRRGLLARAAALGLSWSVGAALLSACGGDDDNDKAATKPAATSAATSATTGGAVTPTPGEAATSAATQATSGDIKPGGSITFGLDLEPDNLDPAVTPFAVSHSVMMNVYDSLIWLGNDGQYYPGLATKWEVQPDGLLYTFNLRDDVKFHDGTQFDGPAVQKFLDRVIDPATKSGFAANLIGPYGSTEVSDPTTIKITMKGPFAAFVDGMSQAFLGIPSQTAVEKGAEAFGQNPVGSGFMKFKEWVRQDHITLERNPDYKWGSPLFANKGAAYLDQISFRFYSDDATRVSAIQAGDVQLILPVPAAAQKDLEDSGDYTIINATTPGVPSINFLVTTAFPTDDLAVRKAIVQATDRKTIVDTAYFGTVKEAFGPLWDGTVGYSKAVEDYYPFDTDAAMKTLEDAGWTKGSDGIYEKGGKKLALNWQATSFDQPHAELTQAQLKAAGMDTKINMGEFSLIGPAVESGGTNFAGIGWISSDPVILTNLFHSKKAAYGWSKIADTSLDTMLDEGETTLDPDKRNQVYADIQKFIMDQALIQPLFGISWNSASPTKYKDIKRDARTYVWFLDTHVEE